MRRPVLVCLAIFLFCQLSVSGKTGATDGDQATLDQILGLVQGLDNQLKEAKNQTLSSIEQVKDQLNGLKSQVEATCATKDANSHSGTCQNTPSDHAWILNYVDSPFGMPSSSHIFGGKLYLFSFGRHDFDIDKDNQICQQYGGYLVELDTEEEFEFLNSLAESINIRLFTGYTDRVTEGKFLHIQSGKELSVGRWYSGQPDDGNSNQDCVEFWDGDDLVDRECDDKSRYICEVPQPF